jgi:hypothetical protein
VAARDWILARADAAEQELPFGTDRHPQPVEIAARREGLVPPGPAAVVTAPEGQQARADDLVQGRLGGVWPEHASSTWEP